MTYKIMKQASFWRMLLPIVIALLFCLFLQQTARADSYIVTASVPYVTPTQAAQFLVTSTTVTSNPVSLHGTCGVISPLAIVSLWSGPQLLGAIPCRTDGTFSLSVNLQPGTNVITPKTSNIVNVYGPDGDSITYIYNPYIPPTQTAPEPSLPPLQISSQQPFDIIDSSGDVSINVTVVGGATPYIIELSWGDGTTAKQTITEPGTYTFFHTYKKKRDYIANVKVKDSKGVVSDFSVPFGHVKDANDTNQNSSVLGVEEIKNSSITLKLAVFVPVMATAIASTFLLGKLHQVHVHTKQAPKLKLKKLRK